MNKIAVIDFGGQYTHLIANRIRRLGVYSEILLPSTPSSALSVYCGIILSGSPHSVTDPGSPSIDKGIFALGVPILGLCYGHQLIAKLLGGSVRRGLHREYGIAEMSIIGHAPVFAGINDKQQIWMSHGDAVEVLPKGFEVLATTPDCPVAAAGDRQRRIYGFQFHPEVTDTPHGMEMLDNFITQCECERDWNPGTFLKELYADIRKTAKGKKVFLLVSGGVDSTVCFALLNKALGAQRVMGLHIDNGLMRLNESVRIKEYMLANGFDNLIVEDAADAFLAALDGVSEPEAKRKIIGEMFLKVKDVALGKLKLDTKDWLLGQGTIYPDTIESAGTQHADKIKTHHNRVDVILELIEKGLVIEPLSQLYKDEVRELGEAVGIPHTLIWRHPFPGPGLGVRALCSSGDEKQVDAEVMAAVASIAQEFGFSGSVLPIRSVGVQGDSRTYAHPALIEGPCDWGRFENLSTAMTNRVKGVNRVVYNLTPGNGAFHAVKAFLTKERLDILRQIDDVVTEALYRHKEYSEVWQMPVVLLPLVNEKGGQCVVLRPVRSEDAMTARYAPLSGETIASILEGARKIDGIGSVFFDLTHKPPGTIEWE